MKTHLSLATTDLGKSVAFYSTLLDTMPANIRADYALFITEQPGLELAIDVRNVVDPAKDVHFGVCVESVDQVEHAIARLEASHLAVSMEREDTCCSGRAG